MIGRCDRVGCASQGKWWPVLEVWPVGARRDGVPAIFLLHCRVCHAHMDGLTIEAIVSDRNFSQMEAICEELGWQRPDRASIRIGRRRIQDPETN